MNNHKEEQPDKGQGQIRLTPLPLEAALARDVMNKQAADRERAQRQDRANRGIIKLLQLAKSLARPKTSNKSTSINEAALRKFVRSGI